MDIQKKIKEITQSRSNYQLEKFVLGQHHSSEMQYVQLLMEINSLTENAKQSELKIKKIKAEAKELRDSGKESDAIEAEIKELQIPSLEAQLAGSSRELAHLEKLYNQYPEYTREEIESAQKDYWDTRLTRVAQLQFLQSQTGVTWAQLEALQQANIIEEAMIEIPTMNKIQNNLTQLTMDRKNEND